MSRTQFAPELRAAIWIDHSKKCVYCGELIQLRELEIDHILPEALDNSPERFERIRGELGLPAEFLLNSNLNLVPSHIWCNAKKRDRIFNPANVRFYLELAASKSESIDAMVPRLELQARKEEILASVRAAIESGNIEIQEH